MGNFWIYSLRWSSFLISTHTCVYFAQRIQTALLLVMLWEAFKAHTFTLAARSSYVKIANLWAPFRAFMTRVIVKICTMNFNYSLYLQFLPNKFALICLWSMMSQMLQLHHKYKIHGKFSIGGMLRKESLSDDDEFKFKTFLYRLKFSHGSCLLSTICDFHYAIVMHRYHIKLTLYEGERKFPLIAAANHSVANVYSKLMSISYYKCNWAIRRC